MRTPAARMIDAAIAVADYAPPKRGQYVTSAQIYWPLIIELRSALDDMGIDWRSTKHATRIR